MTGVERRVVLLGTGTGVGKTYLGVGLLEAWNTLGQAALGLKPVESGVTDAVQQTDAGLLTVGAARSRPLRRWSFTEALSPHLAARRAGAEVVLSELCTWIAQEEEHYLATHDTTGSVITLVETAGGAFSPLSEVCTCRDLAEALGPAIWILVAADGLGVLHHVHATQRALAGVGRGADLVVLSAACAADASTGKNADELARVVFPALGEAAPRHSEVFTVARGARDFGALAQTLLKLTPR